MILLHKDVHFLEKIAISLIIFYQKFLSNTSRGCCIYTPTCSTYSILAIKRYGAFKGVVLSTKRIVRCRPSFEGGHDPLN